MASLSNAEATTYLAIFIFSAGIGLALSIIVEHWND